MAGVTLPHVETAVLALAAGNAIVLAWNVVYGGRIARLRRAPRILATLSGVCGLLVAPALVAHVAASSLYGGRAVGGIGWIWPLTTLLFVAQAAYATLRRLVTPLLGVPLLLYDLLVAVVACTRWALVQGGAAPDALLAVGAAQAAVLGTVIGHAALVSPLATAVPLVVPAYPARWRLTRTVRALLAVATAFGVAVTLLELPRAIGAIASYAPWSADRLRERPAGDFAVGVRLLTVLDGPPPGLVARQDLALRDSLDVDAVHVVLRPGALTLAALDSLNRVVDPARRDSALLIVSLAYDDADGAAWRAAPAAFLERRLRQVERVARALRPDVLLPASAPYGDAAAAVGRLPVAQWERYLAAAAARAHAVNRRIRVGIAAARYDAADSALYAWAATPASPVELLGFVVEPSFGGAAGVDARLRAADRWLRAAAAASTTASAGDAPRRPKPHWVFAVRGFPAVHGDASQERTIWHTLAWATAHPEVVGVIAAESGDYGESTGLRAANGRLRGVVAAVRRGVRGLRESAVP